MPEKKSLVMVPPRWYLNNLRGGNVRWEMNESLPLAIRHSELVSESTKQKNWGTLFARQ